MTSAVSDRLRLYLRVHALTVPHVEALLLLRADRTWWLPPRLASRLYVPEPRANDLLVDLAGLQIAETGQLGYRFHPETPDLEALSEELADAWAHRLAEVAGMIHDQTDAAATTFAAAFRFRKDS